MKPSSRDKTKDGVSCKDASLNDKLLIQNIISLPESSQEQAAKEHFQKLLRAATQPRYLSGNACIRLCFFIEQCRKSISLILQSFAFSYSTSLDLFTFYIEWTDKNQHRSMRQVLELLAALVNTNPESQIGEAIKHEILQSLLSIVTHQSVQPLVKPAFKVLEYFLSKGTITVRELMQAHGKTALFQRSNTPERDGIIGEDTELQGLFISTVFDWMSLPDTSPAAGKLLVTCFQVIRKELQSGALNESYLAYTILWQQWIRQGLLKHPNSLENIKIYLFPPLFKIDRVGSLEFLKGLADKEDSRILQLNDLDAEAFLFLSAMEVGKRCGLVDEIDAAHPRESEMAGNCIPLPEKAIGTLLTHNSSIVRSSAFAVLISSSSSIRPFPNKNFELIRSNLPILHADTDAKFRNEVLSSTKHMLERLKGAMLNLSKEVSVSSIHAVKIQAGKEGWVLERSKLLQEHVDFLEWYTKFLLEELIPTASYQRHITALRALQIAMKLGILASSEEVKRPASHSADLVWPRAFTQKSVRLLLDLLMDPFEDVRTSASELVEFAPQECFFTEPYQALSYNVPSGAAVLQDAGKQSSLYDLLAEAKANQIEISLEENIPGLLLGFLKRAEDASKRTGRADLADGVARAFGLLCSVLATTKARFLLLESLVTDLESKVSVAEGDLAKAVLIAPVHGQFAAVRLVWDRLTQKPENLKYNWADMQHRLIECCSRIWASVKDVLCNDSPEGHLPQDFDELDVLDTKNVLSYSFRAIHESSNLLRVIAGKIGGISGDGSPLVPHEAFRDAGSLTFEQLSSLRHRGAFSTVSLTFAVYCRVSQGLPTLDQSGLPLVQEWYQGALTCIYQQASTTRRSAGIPALITGILSANAKYPTLEDVMTQLKNMARQPVTLSEKDDTTLPQVHAFNSIKEIFKSSTLRRRCDSHITDCFQLAAEGLKSQVWAIRNCALLLLRSLIDCLFGTSESKLVAEAGWDGKSIRLSYDRYPALPELLLQLLKTGKFNQSISGSLEIGCVESVFPALDIIRRAGPPKQLRDEIYTCVLLHIGSNVWHIRDIAARTTSVLLLGDGWLFEVCQLLNVSSESANQAHGILLTLKYLLERRLDLNHYTTLEELSTLALMVEQFMLQEAHWKTSAVLDAAHEEFMTSLAKLVFADSERYWTTVEEINSSVLRTIIFNENVFDGPYSQLKRYAKPSEETETSSCIVNTTNIGSSSALLIRAMSIRALHAAAVNRRRDHMRQLEQASALVVLASRVEIDVAVSILQQMPFLWNVQKSSPQILFALTKIYFEVISVTSSSSICGIALQNLADVIDRLFRSRILSHILAEKLCALKISALVSSSPDLSNAEIRITGALLALEYILNATDERVHNRIRAWGYLLISNCKAENDFEVRYASITALDTFYNALKLDPLPPHQHFVPSLLALYDALNDDDDEVREVAAYAASHILGQRLVPLAAANQFLSWLKQVFGNTEAFCNAVLQRVTNDSTASIESLESAGKRLAAALEDDNSLFIEEEQNLYIDEVRESIAWTSLLSTAQGPLWDKAVDKISVWALSGLHKLHTLAQIEDGPLGWTSKPRVFALSMMIVLTAKAIISKEALSCRQTVVKSLWDGEAAIKAVIDEKADDEADNKVTKQISSGVAQHQEADPAALRAAMTSLLKVGSENKLHPVLLDELGNLAV